jgi:photosystem II stability/assembly factor-like uncharacterized protein
VVAAGYAVTRAGHIPIVVVSVDGGKQWHQIVLGAPGGLGAVTAVTGVSGGFVAVGQAGPAHAQFAVTWHSQDGLTWSGAVSSGFGLRLITVLTASGRTVTGVAQQGATPSMVTVRVPAVPTSRSKVPASGRGKARTVAPRASKSKSR